MGLDSPAAGTTDQAIEILESVWSGRLLEPGAQSLAIAYVRVGRREDAEQLRHWSPARE